MSGLEIAGLALGAFPLLLEGVKGLRTQFEKVEFFWEFRNRFEDFLADIERERIAYDQILRFLLDSLNVAPHQQTYLLQFPRETLPSSWGSSRLNEQIQRKFRREESEWLKFQIKRVHEALDRLCGLLATYKAYQMETHDLRSEWFRLKTSFFSEKDEIFSRIVQGNKDIFNFLDRASRISTSGRLESLVPKSHQKQWRNLQNIQKHSRLLYACFQKHWSCNCKTGHPCSVTIQKVGKGSKDDHNIMVMFSSLSHTGHLRLRVEVEDPASVSTPQTQAIDNIEGSNQAAVTRLTRQVATKNARKRAATKGGTLKKLVGSSTTALLAIMPEAMKEHRDEMERRPKRLKKAPISESTGANSLSSGITVSDAASEVSVSTPSSSNMEPPTRSKVRFHVAGDDPPPEPESGSGMDAKNNPIENLCRPVTSGLHQPCLGYLHRDNLTRVYLHAEAANQTTNRVKVDSLNSAIKGGVSRPERLRIALTAALFVGGMGDSPWLKPDWTSEDVCLWTDSENSTHQPYFLLNSLLNTLHSPSKSQGRTNLYLLGIVLLELVFGERLEDQPIRDKYLRKDGTPNEMTDFCTAFEWKTKAEQEVGFLIADGIGWCLGCLHGPPQDIGSPECLQNIWQNIIFPLEDFLKHWYRDPIF